MIEFGSIQIKAVRNPKEFGPVHQPPHPRDISEAEKRRVILNS